jgi:hypothetical protein
MGHGTGEGWTKTLAKSSDLVDKLTNYFTFILSLRFKLRLPYENLMANL